MSEMIERLPEEIDSIVKGSYFTYISSSASNGYIARKKHYRTREEFLLFAELTFPEYTFNPANFIWEEDEKFWILEVLKPIVHDAREGIFSRLPIAPFLSIDTYALMFETMVNYYYGIGNRIFSEQFI